MQRSGGLAFDFSSMLGDMAKNVVSNLTQALPKIAIDTLSAVVVSKLSDKLGVAPAGGAAAKPAAKPAAAPAQAAPDAPQAASAADEPATAAPASPLPPTAAKSGLPGWAIPVGIGVVVLGAAALALPALRRRR